MHNRGICAQTHLMAWKQFLISFRVKSQTEASVGALYTCK